MASITIGPVNKKLPRQTITSGTDLVWTADIVPPKTQCYVQFVPSVAAYYHSTADAAATDGYPIPAGEPFTLLIWNGLTLYFRTQSGSGSLDAVVLS